MQHRARNLLLIFGLGSSLAVAHSSSAQIADHFAEDATHLFETGQAFLQAGAFDDAEIVFNQLFTSVRVSQGLYHEAQISALDQLINVSLARRDWDQFNSHLAYHEWLADRLYREQSFRQAEHLQTSAQWHHRAAVMSLGERRTWHLIRARNLTWQAVSALEREGAQDDRLVPLLYDIALTHYYLTNEASRRGLTSMEVRTDAPVVISGWAMTGGESGRRSYTIGSELLQRIERIYRQSAEVDPLSLAAAMTYQGDWQQLFGRPARASAYYQQAVELLTGLDDHDALEALFGREILLPAPVFSTRPDLKPVPDSTTVDDADTRLRRPVLKNGELMQVTALP